MATAAESSVSDPWRDTKLQWTEEEYIQKRQAIAARAPLLDETETYKILLIGPVGAGKSSFINTIFSAFRNEIGQIAINASDIKSVTNRYRVHRFRENIHDRAIRVTLCDTMGFDREGGDEGPSIRDIEHILDGHINDGYEFKPRESINFKSPHFNQTPGPMDKVHALAIVFDGATFKSASHQHVEKMKEITMKAKERDIRWLVIMTKIDDISAGVVEDVTSVHRDEAVGDLVENISNRVGINQSNIFPVQNYAREIHPSMAKNILALHTLENILRLADNTLESQAGSLPQDVTVPKMELLPSAWRSEDNLTEKAVHSMWSELSSIESTKVPKLRVCLMGPSGGGKSALVNSVLSEVYQRIVLFADTGCGSQATTTCYKEYVLQHGRDGEELNVIMCDTMGVLPSGGLNREDIATVLDGKVPKMSDFNPANPLSRSVAHVSLTDRPHVLGLVINGADLDTYSPELIEKIKLILTTAKARPREIPRVVLVTHIDEVCGFVAEDPTKVFRSQDAKKCLRKVKEKLGIPMVDILPIISFVDDTEIDWRKSALILQALHHLLERAQDYVVRSPQKKGWIW